MNEEIMTNEAIDEIELVEVYDEPKSGKGVIGALVVGTLGLAAAGITAWCVKNKDKLEQKRIQKLRDKGYVILTPDEVAAEDDYDEDEE